VGKINVNVGTKDELESFFGHLDYRLKLHEKMNAAVQPLLATKFNVFDFIAPDENRLSDILACLLNPHGNHAQGAVFLEEFLRLVCDLEFDVGAVHRIEVKREERTGLIDRNRRRIDILIDIKGFLPQDSFGVGIENKPWAGEQPEQLNDYRKQLREAYGDRFKLLYLSASGEEPESIPQNDRAKLQKSGHLVCASYSSTLLIWLEYCERSATSDKVRWFVRDFHAYLNNQFNEEDYDDE
jgi:hypothetical protein